MSSNNPNRVYLDTETTGLHPEEGDEILSLTIVDANGRLLFDERFKPKHKKEWPEAQAVNHISPDDVEHLTTIDAYMEQICRILDRIADEIVGYNIAFDIGFLKAAGATINPDAAIIDTMQEFMDAFGNSNTGHRYQPLSMAAERLGYNWTSAPHGSLSDTLACLAAQKCVDDHNWCVENLELTEDAIMHAKPIEMRMVQRGFQKTAGTSTPEAARLPSRSRFSIGSRALRNSAHESVPPPSSRA